MLSVYFVEITVTTVHPFPSTPLGERTTVLQYFLCFFRKARILAAALLATVQA